MNSDHVHLSIHSLRYIKMKTSPLSIPLSHSAADRADSVPAVMGKDPPDTSQTAAHTDNM